ncbi:hypothetical protein NYE70_17015 [Paenibacillus sp. FSL R5-0407]|uniref:hypothetical protein n=1 Tax=Paenibacillus TaxID=44249 RepID=UPI0025B69C86|nr:hypothetical protein [Paenibacillus vini]MDN4068260.1 hypothetical protein [Paenibacillus vini]
MKINSSTHYGLNLYEHLKQRSDQPAALVEGHIQGLSHDTDTLEISPAARQLAESDIVDHPLKYFGTAQINDSLNRVLQNQPSEVKEAVYGIIQSNFINDITGEETRTALLELGLTQAEYIAKSYMNEDEAAEFMDTMTFIGAISKTRSVDPETNKVHYVTPPQRPVGAPDDYIDLNDMMRKFEPETLSKLQEAIANGKEDWNHILQSFAKKVAGREDWVKEYREGSAKLLEEMKQGIGESRFGNTSTAGLTEFAKGIKDIIANEGLRNKEFLEDSLGAFLRRLGAK